jgi:PPK2 family polyphosphate:nucleotide phosphotransferase
MTYRKRFQIKPGSKVKLSKIDPDSTAENKGKKRALVDLARYSTELRKLQRLLYAENKHSLLICLQALDAAGKDGAINHVLGNMNPQGACVHAFKVPTPEEASHDFLWRIHRQLPGRGEIVVFNRSHYEDVLAVRVHNLAPKRVWSKRFEMINEFEEGLAAQGTHIVKLFLHISREEQLRRLRKRLDDPALCWKISEADYFQRELWPQYMHAYEDVFCKTSTRHAPWYVIPANRKWFRNLAVSRIVIETLQSLNMRLPAPTADLQAIRRKFHAEENEPTNSQDAVERRKLRRS